jgi:hypothetical protein
VATSDEVIRVEVVNVPPVILEKNSVPTTTLEACRVTLDSVSLVMVPVDMVDTSIIGAKSDVRKMADPVIVEKVSLMVESVEMVAVEVVKEVPDRVEKFPLPAYNEEVVVC